LCENIREEGPATNGTFLQPNLACVASIYGRRGDGNGAYNACGACGRQCVDSVYGTYDYHGDVLHLTASHYPFLSNHSFFRNRAASYPVPSHGVSSPSNERTLLHYSLNMRASQHLVLCGTATALSRGYGDTQIGLTISMIPLPEIGWSGTHHIWGPRFLHNAAPFRA
jgi:hypothetical protein